MTDRIKGLIVTLEKNIRDDDAEPIIQAVKLLKGVAAVKPLVSDIEQEIADSRARLILGQKILEVVFPEEYKKVTQ